MRTVELSNHPGAMRAKEHRRRDARQAQTGREYERAVAGHERELEELRRRRDRARAERRWWRWWRLGSALRRTRRRAPRPPGKPPEDPDRERILLAGIEGEELVARELGEALGDDWTLLRGYRNRRGEIDHLLLGPKAIVAIEVKHRNAKVFCDGDDWWFEKYDKYGNLVETGALADRRGRSPSRQLNEPADELVKFLATRRCDVTVTRLVLFTHARSVANQEDLAHQTVNGVGTSGREVVAWLAGLEASLSPKLLAKVERLAIQDHRHHNRGAVSRAGRR